MQCEAFALFSRLFDSFCVAQFRKCSIANKVARREGGKNRSLFSCVCVCTKLTVLQLPGVKDRDIKKVLVDGE